jgi:hypothetical protein
MSRIVIVICSKMDCVVLCCMVNMRELKAIRRRVLAVNIETTRGRYWNEIMCVK